MLSSLKLERYSDLILALLALHVQSISWFMEEGWKNLSMFVLIYKEFMKKKNESRRYFY